MNSMHVHKCTSFAGAYSDFTSTICNTESSQVMQLLVPLLAMLRIQCVIIHALLFVIELAYLRMLVLCICIELFLGLSKPVKSGTSDE